MLKYLYCKEVFSEIPSEISLGVSLSGCTIRCPQCHSKDLWEDKGIPLTVEELYRLLNRHKGITCLLLLGGEHDIPALKTLFQEVHEGTVLRSAWYCGLDAVPEEHEDIVKYLDYLKTGHYDEKLGGLVSPTTNQILYAVQHNADGTYNKENINDKFKKQKL